MGNQALKDQVLAALGSDAPQSVTQIAEKIGSKSQAVMDIIDELDELGLLNSFVDGNAVLYSLVHQEDANRGNTAGFSVILNEATTNKMKELHAQSMADAPKKKSKSAVCRAQVIELLKCFPGQIATRIELLTAVDGLMSSVDMDAALKNLRNANEVHSVGRGVVKLGPMPVADAADAIEKVVNQAFEAKPEIKALAEEKPEAVIAAPVAEQLTALNKNTDVGNAQDYEQILPAMTLMHGLVIDRLACFDDGTTTVILNDGQELIFNPVDAKRIYRHMYRFFN